ncbi:peptidoglycan-binding domain-containing protein [Clostridium botulinum]|uniref:peptidoglycan-binding domain-containing protein n=1 Tax=Clostridium botulinum TaxID=1491 RepID=UPI000D137DB6|nr:peptidoglycan-binding protein [Clostridium botulinum]AVQ46115.1 hypothetical protein C7M60_10070 [Clostridium botulinum]AVQ49732.1 hypothetical protein C7M58_10450 [Clostridium botulinum]
MENKIKLLNNSRNNIDEYKKSNINKLQKNNLNNNENKKSNTNNVIDLKDKLQISNDLSIGSSGKDVSDLQSSLKKIGIYKDSVDGYYGKSTEEAVKKFQRSKNIEETGIADGKVKYEISKDITDKKPIYRVKRSADYNWYDEFNKNMDEFNKHMEEFDKIMSGTNENNEVNNNSNERIKDTETNQGTKTNEANSSDDFDWDQWSKDMDKCWDEMHKHLDEFQKGVNNILNALDEINEGLKEMNKGIDEANKGADKAINALNQMNNVVDGMNKLLNEMNKNMDQMNNSMDQIIENLNQMNETIRGMIKNLDSSISASEDIFNALKNIESTTLRAISTLFNKSSHKATSDKVASNNRPQTHYNDIVKDTMKQSKLTDYYGVDEKFQKKTVLVKTKNFEVSLIKSVGVRIPGQWLNASVNGKNISSNPIIQKTYAGNFLKSICGKFESPAIDLSLGSFSISKDGVELSGSIDIYYSKNIKANGINVTGTAKDSLSVSGKITKDDIDNLKQMGGAAALAVGTALVIGAVSSEVGTYGASTPASVPAFIWGTQLLQHAL